MTCFRKYNHLERYGHRETHGIDIGLVHVFPKLDGTNAVAWLGDDGTVRAGSRNRELSLEQDNAGFCAWLLSEEREATDLREFLRTNPNMILYGEWMVPHTLKTYREDTWRRFWIFDVYCTVDGGTYIPYDLYSHYPLLERCDLIQPICTIENPSENQMRAQIELNTYLIQDGAGLGEGVVVKNYAWKNNQGTQTWAKFVRNIFKEEAARAFGITHKNGAFQVEVAIAEEFCTPALVSKTRAKILLDLANEKSIDLAQPNAQQQLEAENRHKVIPQLLGRVFHDLITEETWTFLKKHKNPTVDFKKLQQQVTVKVKAYAGDLF